MADTLLQKWNKSFSSVSNDPTSSRQNTSAASVQNTNSLSVNADGMNNWTYTNQVPQGRHTYKIGMLWKAFLGGGGVENEALAIAAAELGSGNLADTSLRGAQSDMSLKYDTATYGEETNAQTKVKEQIRKNNKIRAVSATDAINAFFVGFTKSDHTYEGPGFDAFFAAADEVGIAFNSFTKSNYRMGAADPNGAFGRFTEFAVTNTIVADGDNVTISLDTFRAQQ